VSGIAWLAVAFIAVWAGLGAYLLLLGRRQASLERRMDEVDRSSQKRQSERERE
jgi:CcmD family protein